MSIFRGKALRRNRFSKSRLSARRVVHFIISLAMVFNISALGVFLMPSASYATQNSNHEEEDHDHDDEYYNDDDEDLSAKPGLIITKTNNLDGENASVGIPFKWILRVENMGSAKAVFNKGLDMLKDSLPSSGASYGEPTVIGSGIAGSGEIDCEINHSEDLICEARSGKVEMPIDSFFDVFIDVTPTSSGSLVNPRVDCKCKVDYMSHISEADENNNNCSNTVLVDALPMPGKIRIQKKMDIDGDGTIDLDGSSANPALQGWKFSLDDPTDLYTNESGFLEFDNVPSGMHYFVETNEGVYSFTGAACLKDGSPVGSVDAENRTVSGLIIESGDIIECTVINTRDTGSIIVHKNVLDSFGNDISDNHPFNVEINAGNPKIIAEGADAAYNTLPTGTYTIAESADEAYELLSYSSDADSETPGAQIVVVKGVVSHLTITNKQKTITPTPAPTPNISVTKTTDKISVKPGESFKYKIHVANTGTGAATGVAVSDTVPAGLKIDGVGCSVSGGATCNLTSTANPIGVSGDLPVSSFFDVFVDVTVKSDAAIGTIKNTATVTHGGSGFSGNFSDSGLSITALPVVQPENAKPVANAHGPYEAILKDGKTTINLIGTGTDTDGSIVKYEWDFEGDGIFDLAILASPTVTNGNVSHIYTKAGVYKPILRVTDDKGAVGTDATEANILAHGTAMILDVGPDGLTVTADGQLALFATATDSFGNSWDATADTAFTVNDPCGIISQAVYLPCRAGEWGIQAAYQTLTDKAGVKVVVGELSRLEISPYAKPFVIKRDKSQVFTVKGFDADGNEVTVLDPEWETTGQKVPIGKIDQNGKFTSTHGGIGTVTAKVGKLSASVGVVVKDPKPAAPTKKPTTITTTTTGTGGQAVTGEEEEVAGGTIEEEPVVSPEETKPAQEEGDGEVAGEEEQACTTLPWWVWYLLAGFYAVFLIIYYMNLRRLDKEHGLVRNWWVVPLLLSGVMLGIYFLYRCPGVFLRWPWALILIGVIISAVYYQSREPEDLPPVGPMSNDENIKTI